MNILVIDVGGTVSTFELPLPLTMSIRRWPLEGRCGVESPPGASGADLLAAGRTGRQRDVA
jgi:hypothetical protein